MLIKIYFEELNSRTHADHSYFCINVFGSIIGYYNSKLVVNPSKCFCNYRKLVTPSLHASLPSKFGLMSNIRHSIAQYLFLHLPLTKSILWQFSFQRSILANRSVNAALFSKQLRRRKQEFHREKWSFSWWSLQQNTTMRRRIYSYRRKGVERKVHRDLCVYLP